jgi:hypothetical protein
VTAVVVILAVFVGVVS